MRRIEWCSRSVIATVGRMRSNTAVIGEPDGETWTGNHGQRGEMNRSTPENHATTAVASLVPTRAATA